MMEAAPCTQGSRRRFQAGRILDFNESPLLVGLPEYITLVNLIREFRPDVLLTSHPFEVGRQDHMDCGRCVIAAVDYAPAAGFLSPLAPHSFLRNLQTSAPGDNLS
jgi:LmbE family N-acetylglucosaminyl deacetylase